MITAGQVRLVAVDTHRIDAVVVAPGRYAGHADTLPAYALRDGYGWAITRRRATGKHRTVARVDGYAEPMARRLVATALIVAALGAKP